MEASHQEILVQQPRLLFHMMHLKRSIIIAKPHSGMGGSIVGIHTDETKADQYASNCVLSLPLVGSTGDVSASIACTSSLKQCHLATLLLHLFKVIIMVVVLI